MANFLVNNVFRIAVCTLNFMSPSIVADILLHPFDFATVLLQIAYDPEGIKYETTPLVSVLVQYALFTFYIPYLLTSMHGLQFMGMPHPSIFYYVSYIYKTEGLIGCYRGLMAKIFERIIMVSVSDKVKRSINKDPVQVSSSNTEEECDQDMFLQTLINSICSQFFAVLASHPFHVLMVSSFAEFTYNKNSSFLELSHSIYADDGYFGFFTGLTARLLGELLSLIFSLSYTAIINKQLRPQQPVIESPQPTPAQRTATHLVNYVTDASRFTAFKQTDSTAIDRLKENDVTVEEEEGTNLCRRQTTKQSTLPFNCLASFIQKPSRRHQLRIRETRDRRAHPVLAYIPLTSKLFYYIMLRDFLSKKISTPFFLVCHCAIVLDTGWDKFPLLTYLDPLVDIVQIRLTPSKKKQFYFNLIE